MSTWGEDDFNEEVQAFIDFDDDGGGSFPFGYVQGHLDYLIMNRGEEPAIEVTWEEGDGADGTSLSGRGWATLRGDELHGSIFIHLGDDSGFIAGRARISKGKWPWIMKRSLNLAKALLS